MNYQWTRTDGDTYEYLRLVRLDSGKDFMCAELEGRRYPYLVQITTGPELGDDFVGLYNLDGDRFDPPNDCSWELVDGPVPSDVIDQIERGWEYGTSLVERA